MKLWLRRRESKGKLVRLNSQQNSYSIQVPTMKV